MDATIKSLRDNTTLPGHLPSLVSAIAPAVKATMDRPGDKLANAIRQNVIDNLAKLKSATPILSAALAQVPGEKPMPDRTDAPRPDTTEDPAVQP